MLCTLFGPHGWLPGHSPKSTTMTNSKNHYDTQRSDNLLLRLQLQQDWCGKIGSCCYRHMYRPAPLGTVDRHALVVKTNNTGMDQIKTRLSSIPPTHTTTSYHAWTCHMPPKRVCLFVCIAKICDEVTDHLRATASTCSINMQL